MCGTFIVLTVTAGRRLAAIVFTDLAGYTELAQRDEAGALRLLHEQDKLLRPLLTKRRGRKVKAMGDGLLLEFPNALDAVSCAVELQQRVHERGAGGGDAALRIRVGVHLGDVQREGSDILGDSVNIASRIEPLAEPGGICVSEQVFAQVHNKLPYRLESLGAQGLKGVEEPVQVYRVVLPWLGGPDPAPAASVPRLAVLPLANISPDPNDAYFADGLTEELISTLAQVRGLRVISHTSVNQYRGTTKPVARIGSELGVDHVLEGSVRKAGDRLRITVQLIDTRTDEHRWAQTYDRQLENVFAIQADVAERAADSLKVTLLRSEREALREEPTRSLAAHEHYLRGIRAERDFGSAGEGLDRVDREIVDHFERALREDPRYSSAYSALATHLLATGGMTRAAKGLFPRARELAAKAVELDPDSSDAHTALGNLAMQADLDWARAETEFRRAIELNPSNSAAHAWYAFLLMTLQRLDEAERENRAAIELDPLWALPRFQLAAAFEYAGDTAGWLDTLERVVAVIGNLPGVGLNMALVHVRQGDPAGARALLDREGTPADLPSRTAHALVLGGLGDLGELRTLMRDFEEGRIAEFVSPYGAAMAYSYLGEKEKALAILSEGQRDGDRALWAYYQSTLLDPVRDDPRFVRLIAEMRLPAGLRRPRLSPRTA